MLSEDDAANNWVKEQKETPNTDMIKSVNILDVIDQLDNDEIDKVVFSKNMENFQKTFIEKLKQANIDTKTVDNFNKMFNNFWLYSGAIFVMFVGVWILVRKEERDEREEQREHVHLVRVEDRDDGDGQRDEAHFVHPLRQPADEHPVTDKGKGR